MAVVIGAAAMVAALPGCAQQKRQDLAEEVTRSLDRGGRVQVGQLLFNMRIARAPGGVVPAGARGGTLGSVGVSLDLRARRAAVLGPGGREVIALFEPKAYFARRITQSKIDRRLWARLELDRLPDGSAPTFTELGDSAGPGDLVVLNPVFLTDLLKGVLTGSVRELKPDREGNRRIKFNVSIDKANRKLRLHDDERDTREKLLRSLAIKDDVHRGQVVLRKDGSLAAALFTFAERPDKQSRIDIGAIIGLQPLSAGGKAPDFTSPGRDVTVRIPALGTLKGAVTDQIRTPGRGPQLPPVRQPPAGQTTVTART